jgi:hypothetical protein
MKTKLFFMTGELSVGFKKDEETIPNFNDIFLNRTFFIVPSFCHRYNLTGLKIWNYRFSQNPVASSSNLKNLKYVCHLGAKTFINVKLEIKSLLKQTCQSILKRQ